MNEGPAEYMPVGISGWTGTAVDSKGPVDTKSNSIWHKNRRVTEEARSAC